jgi:hypothetical protein
MRLLPSEEDRLLLFLAAELARRRRARGLALTQACSTRGRSPSPSRRTSTSSRSTGRCASTARRRGGCDWRSRPAPRWCSHRVSRGPPGWCRSPALASSVGMPAWSTVRSRARRARGGAGAGPRAGLPRCLSGSGWPTATSGWSPRASRTPSSPAGAGRCATTSESARSAAASRWRSPAVCWSIRCSACATISPSPPCDIAASPYTSPQSCRCRVASHVGVPAVDGQGLTSRSSSTASVTPPVNHGNRGGQPHLWLRARFLP